MKSNIYSGHVTHRGFKPIKHYFAYRTFSILFDLDEFEEIDKNVIFFSLNKFNLFSFYNKDHGSRDGSNLKTWVLKTLNDYNLDKNITSVKLLCFPRILGYVFNPLRSFIAIVTINLKLFFTRLKILLVSNILMFLK
jgi:Uncharacterized conserved protein